MHALLVISISKYPTAVGFLMRLKPITATTPALGPNDLIIQMPGLDLTSILVAPMDQLLWAALLITAKQIQADDGNISVAPIVAGGSDQVISFP